MYTFPWWKREACVQAIGKAFEEFLAFANEKVEPWETVSTHKQQRYTQYVRRTVWIPRCVRTLFRQIYNNRALSDIRLKFGWEKLWKPFIVSKIDVVFSAWVIYNDFWCSPYFIQLWNSANAHSHTHTRSHKAISTENLRRMILVCFFFYSLASHEHVLSLPTRILTQVYTDFNLILKT